jgi:hypothetical protein
MPLRDLNSLKAINVGDMPPAGWYPDPTGRPEGFYWNGSAWEPRKVRPTKRRWRLADGVKADERGFLI